MTVQLTPKLQTFVGALAGAQVPAQATAGQAQAAMGSWQAPKLAAADVANAKSQVMAELKLAKPEDLANVTQGQCMAACGDPMQGLILWALVMAVQIYLPPCEAPKKCVLKPRTDPLPTLGAKAIMGNYEAPQPPPDPLIITFDKVAKSTPDNPTKLWMINRSNLWSDEPIELPGDPSKAADGEYSLTLGEDWLDEHGIHAGNVLELYQTKGSRESEGRVIPINTKGPGVQKSPKLPPGDVVGNVSPKSLFRRVSDPVPPQIRPECFSATLADGCVELSAANGLEPRARVEMVNLRTNQSTIGTVGSNGKMCMTVAAEAGDPMMIKAVDHSHELGSFKFERRMTLVAGQSTPLLAQNPELAIDGPPSLSLGRTALTDECQKLTIDAGVTPGTVVKLHRAGSPAKSAVGVADECGSVSINLPFTPHADDVLIVEGKNPFGIGNKRGEWQKKAAFTAELELNSDGSLDLVKAEGAVSKGSAQPAGVNQKDDVRSAQPDRSIRAQVESAELSCSTYDRRTWNRASLGMKSDIVCDNATAVFNFDSDKGEIVVTIGAQKGGGWRAEELGETSTSSYFQSVGRGAWSDQNSVVGKFRQALPAKGKGGSIPIRFETPEGEVFSRGTMSVDMKTPAHSTGARQKNHPVWYASLDAASVVGC